MPVAPIVIAGTATIELESGAISEKPRNNTDAIHLPPDLLAQARQAAREEDRAVDELVSDAVRRYLQERNQAAPVNTAEPMKKKRLSELFAPLRGLDIDFSRNPSTGRPVDL